MIKTTRRLTLVAAIATAAVTAFSAAALAAGDTGDNISPASTAFIANNSGSITFKGTIDGFGFTVHCTTSSMSGTTPASGLSGNINPPTFSGCTDNFGGTDNVKTNQNNGSWALTLVDSPTETGTEPNSGDQTKITMPKAGATFSSSFLPGCTVTAAPNGAASFTGSYNDSTTTVFSSASMPVSGSGCSSSSTATISGTYVNNISIHDTN